MEEQQFVDHIPREKHRISTSLLIFYVHIPCSYSKCLPQVIPPAKPHENHMFLDVSGCFLGAQGAVACRPSRPHGSSARPSGWWRPPRAPRTPLRSPPCLGLSRPDRPEVSKDHGENTTGWFMCIYIYNIYMYTIYIMLNLCLIYGESQVNQWYNGSLVGGFTPSEKY